MTRKKTDHANPAIAAASTSVQPKVTPRSVDDAEVFKRARDFSEALRQTEPLADSGSREAAQAVRALRDGTARPNGLLEETAQRMATEPRSLDQLIRGRFPEGKAAEIVSARDYLDLHEGGDPGMVNPPGHLSANVKDVVVSPDDASRRDLILRCERGDGVLISVPNGQVKTGSGASVTRGLLRMARSRDYGRVGIVDARFVNPDGSPRVAADAFTETQARQLLRARVRLRGIRDLDKRSGGLVDNVRKYQEDGLRPAKRWELEALRDDIARAYQPRGIAYRVAGGAALAAASATLISLVIQAASDGEIDVAAIGSAAGVGAAYGAGGALADAALYHLASNAGLAPEAAKSMANTGVVAGFCLLALGADLAAEVKLARQGEVTVTSAVSGSAIKASLDLLPLVLAPLGLAGVPVLVGTQLGGRWLIARARRWDAELAAAVAEDMERIEAINQRHQRIRKAYEDCCSDCEDADRAFWSAMGLAQAAVENNIH